MNEFLDLAAKLIPAGILGVIWFDIRKVKGEVATKYLTLDKHSDLCQIASLTWRQALTEAKEEIITEIRNNNK